MDEDFPLNEYISPVDGHRHFGDAGRAECAVCCLEAERDALRTVVEAVRVMWDNIVGTENDAIMGFPVADYDPIDRALDALAASEEAA